MNRKTMSCRIHAAIQDNYPECMGEGKETIQMKTGKKSIEQYIFRSNALMVLAVLGLFLIVNAMVFALYGSRVRNDTAEDLEVAQGAFSSSAYLDMWIADGMSIDSESLQSLGDLLETVNFRFFVEEEGTILYSGMEDIDLGDFEKLDEYFIPDGKTHMYVVDGFTCITVETADFGLRCYAVSGEYEDFMTTLKETAIWISYYMLNAVLFVVILAVTCSLCTRQLIRHIMVPLNILNHASAEMKKGDYSHPVSYEGDEEFESVCSSFEEMRAEIQRTEQEKANYEKARTEMVVGISHDLRTPLTAIQGTIKGLRDGVVTTPQMRIKFLDTAYRRTQEIDGLLDQLTYFSKIESGSLPLSPEKIEWNEYLGEYVNSLRDGSIEETFQVSFQGTDTLLYSMIDIFQMNRILDNLLENSKKYAGVKELAVTYCLRQEGKQVSLLISDNGNGVLPQKLPYIFDKFYRADESRNQTKGNGLGLYIVKSLVEAMGGSVSAQNAGGLRITLMFPLTGDESVAERDISVAETKRKRIGVRTAKAGQRASGTKAEKTTKGTGKE
ncbi:MAG: HAMP domain-containing histidine kinase [Lachnospiraceae bacterium]|nr:HAMP domain-containing histidine kinase [Lachnospiraceae bacterium]